MAEDKTRPERINKWIPWVVVVPFILVTLVWVWGFNTFKFEEATKGSFPIGPEVKKVRIVTDVGDLDVVIGVEGKVAYDATTMRATGSQEDLARATAGPFTLEHVPSADPSVFEIRATPLPAGFARLPPTLAEEKTPDVTSPRLFRQLNARITVPVHIEVELIASQGSIRVDTRQAPTKVEVEKGDLMLQHISGPLTSKNGDGDTIIVQHRGELDVLAKGKTRITMAEVNGSVRVVNREGEVGLYMPRHCSVDLVARSLTGNVRNGFGLPIEQVGAGTVVRGKIGDGAHKVVAESQKGTLTVDATKPE